MHGRSRALRHHFTAVGEGVFLHLVGFLVHRCGSTVVPQWVLEHCGHRPALDSEMKQRSPSAAATAALERCVTLGF